MSQRSGKWPMVSVTKLWIYCILSIRCWLDGLLRFAFKTGHHQALQSFPSHWNVELGVQSSEHSNTKSAGLQCAIILFGWLLVYVRYVHTCLYTPSVFKYKNYICCTFMLYNTVYCGYVVHRFIVHNFSKTAGVFYASIRIIKLCGILPRKPTSLVRLQCGDRLTATVAISCLLIPHTNHLTTF